MAITPNRPEHADKTEAVAGADPRFSLTRRLTGYAYPEHGNLHNPTPRYTWLLNVDGILVDQSNTKRPLVEAARESGQDYLAEIDARTAETEPVVSAEHDAETPPHREQDSTMNSIITANTTDEELFVPIDLARKSLIENIQNGRRSHDLALAVNLLAAAEGQVYVHTLVRDALVRKHSVKAIRERLLTTLLRGANDEWSGRTNDARRAYFDGLRDEVQEFTSMGTLETLVAQSTEVQA